MLDTATTGAISACSSLPLAAAAKVHEPSVSEIAWRERLIELMRPQLLNHEPVSFDDLVTRMAGADPMLVWSLLHDAAGSGSHRLGNRARLTIRESQRQMSAPLADTDPDLPAPHPLDYEWRFTRPTRQTLMERALAHSPRSILLLGCPTVALTLLSQHPELPVTLVDDNPALPELTDIIGRRSSTYRQLRVDLIANPGVTTGIDADVVIADAPFYPDAMDAFLQAATAGARHRARLLFVLPRFGSRPSAESDVALFYRRAAMSGLRLIRTDKGAVRYLTPPFEEKALRSAGLPNVAHGWRSADLAAFLRARASEPAVATTASERDRWQEVIAGGKRWRVRNDQGGSTVVIGLYPNASGSRVLDTVSRRDVRRHNANVCTNDNEFYATANPALFIQILDSIATGNDPIRRVEDSIGRVLSPDECDEVNLVCSLIGSLPTASTCRE